MMALLKRAYLSGHMRGVGAVDLSSVDCMDLSSGLQINRTGSYYLAVRRLGLGGRSRGECTSVADVVRRPGSSSRLSRSRYRSQQGLFKRR